MADSVAPSALDWALTHVERYGDTDILPHAFEFKAIRQNWVEVRDYLASLDLETHTPTPTFRVLVPKSRFGFRAAHQLHPLDTLLYTAMVYEVAQQVEAGRVVSASKVACSFRIDLGADGRFFQEQDGSRDFHDRSKELAESKRFKSVVVADVADFYNQIYTHRVQSILETVGVSEGRAKNLEAFLLKLTAKQSRGIPVGPYASIVLAEACMDDVDKRLLGRGTVHTRYVDDFRIFCGSRKDAFGALHDLTDYLYTSHRLTLQNAKTRVLTIKKFTRKELYDPEEEEVEAKKDRIQRMLNELRKASGYGAAPTKLGKDDLNTADRGTIRELFAACVADAELRVGLARYLLRRATALRTRALYGDVFDNLSALTPAMRDVALYLAKTISPAKAPEWGERLIAFLREDDVGSLSFVRLWGLHLLQEKPRMAELTAAMALAEESRNALGLRPAALLARAHGLVDWVRQQKENWGNHGHWDRRTIIWAGAVLPATERRKWLELVMECGDLLDKSVAMLAMAGKT